MLFAVADMSFQFHSRSPEKSHDLQIVMKPARQSYMPGFTNRLFQGGMKLSGGRLKWPKAVEAPSGEGGVWGRGIHLPKDGGPGSPRENNLKF